MRGNSVLKMTAAVLLGGALLVAGVDGAADPVFAQGKSGSAGNSGGGNSGGGNGSAGGGSGGASSDAGGGRGASAAAQSGETRGQGAEARGQGAGASGGQAQRPGAGRPEHAGPPQDAPVGAQLSDETRQGLGQGLGQGAPAARMGALNAAHASEEAFANAAPDSQVGRIAAYRDAVLAGEETAAELAETEALLSALDDPEASILTILEGGEIGSPELEAKVREVAELRDAVADGEATQEELNTALAELETLYDEVYAETVARQETLSATLEDSAAEAQRLLEDAANKPLDAEVVAEVNTLLDLPEDPLAGLLLELYATDADAGTAE